MILEGCRRYNHTTPVEMNLYLTVSAYKLLQVLEKLDRRLKAQQRFSLSF